MNVHLGLDVFGDAASSGNITDYLRFNAADNIKDMVNSIAIYHENDQLDAICKMSFVDHVSRGGTEEIMHIIRLLFSSMISL